MSDWCLFDDGGSIGQRGSEGGVILRDEEHPHGSRITLERSSDTAYSITCGVYGWMVHTRFFSDQATAQQALEEMKPALADILDLIPTTEDMNDTKIGVVSDAMSDFVERFP